MPTEGGVGTVYLRNGINYAKFVDEDGRRTTRITGVMSKHKALCIAAGIGDLCAHYGKGLRRAIEELPDLPAGGSNSNGG